MKLESHVLQIDSQIKNLKRIRAIVVIVSIIALDKHPSLMCAARIAPDKRPSRRRSSIKDIKDRP